MLISASLLSFIHFSFGLSFANPSFHQVPLQPFDHSQNYRFDPLLHLPGTSPYYDAIGFGLEHRAPEGCTVDAASYLVRHGAIYCNDAEYEDFIKPFLYKLEIHRGGFSGPLEFLNKWQSPIDENKLEHLTPSGAVDAESIGHHLVKRYPHLAPTVQRVVADLKSRTYDTAGAMMRAFPNDSDIEIVRLNKKELNDGTRAVLPHKACSAFSKSPGTTEQHEFLSVYAPPVSQRLSPYTPDGYNFSSFDILAMQSLCGYESGIRGKRSPLCPLFSDAEWFSYEYAWDMKYAHMVGPLNPLSMYLGFPWLMAQSELFDTIDHNPEENHNSTTGWPSSQRFFLYFTHREVPPFVATALGIFNSSAQCGHDEFPTTHVNYARAWRMSDLIPFLGHVGMEKMTCERPGNTTGGEGQKEEYVRFIANTAPRPLPQCQSGPGASCPMKEFRSIIQAGAQKYGDFDKVCNNKQS